VTRLEPAFAPVWPCGRLVRGGVGHPWATSPFRSASSFAGIDGSDIGTVIGVLLKPDERAIVRWPSRTTYERPDDLIELTQPG
jgi:hypothetical protein